MFHKCLASCSETTDSRWTTFMQELNGFARRYELTEYETYSRIWEYPWLWFQLQPFEGQGLRLLDIGSERSPFPWFLATKGFDVLISDVTPRHWSTWHRTGQRLNASVKKAILNAQQLNLPTASIDIYLSVSVVEHVPDKLKAMAEAARVLKPGGLLIMSFDICEPDKDMSFPEWNGRALTLKEFDEMFKEQPWFDKPAAPLSWNRADMDDYLAWHRTTAPHHNYVTGAALVQRNDHVWPDHSWNTPVQIVNQKVSTFLSVASWKLQQFSFKRVKEKVLNS